MRPSQEVGVQPSPPAAVVAGGDRHVVGMDAMWAEAEPGEDGARPQVPARPRQRRIAMGILRLAARPGLQQPIDHLATGERRGAVQWRLAAGAAVAHEAAGLDPGAVTAPGSAPCSSSTRTTWS